MRVLVDSSVWIDYFRDGTDASVMDYLIDENLLVINQIILAELVPFLELKKQKKVVKLLNAIKKLPLKIEWDEIIRFQSRCLQAGVNGIGISDLLIVQNAKQNQCKLYSMDKHFGLLREIVGVELLVVT